LRLGYSLKAMNDVRRNVLVVEVDLERFETIAPMLARKRFEVDRFPGASGALELVSVVPFRALILGFPMTEVPFDRFLATVKRPGSASSAAPVAIITQEGQLEAARAYLERGVDYVASLGDSPAEFENGLSALLGIQARRAFRATVRLDIVLENARRERFVAQTKDISASGMFVIVRRLSPIGSRAYFEFALPNESKPFCGEAEVTRHAQPPADELIGMGLRFVSFIRNTEERLGEALEELRR
jgi:response regulator RpfG family c-di-GMP phosphodiesterase